MPIRPRARTPTARLDPEEVVEQRDDEVVVQVAPAVEPPGMFHAICNAAGTWPAKAEITGTAAMPQPSQTPKAAIHGAARERPSARTQTPSTIGMKQPRMNTSMQRSFTNFAADGLPSVRECLELFPVGLGLRPLA